MKRISLLVLLLVIAFVTVAAAQKHTDLDISARETILALYPHAGFAAKTWLPWSNTPLYEVGRIDLFGRRLVLASGRDWNEAFQNLAIEINRPIPAPWQP